VSAGCRSGLRDLLPWYVNGSLEGQEAGAVREHLDACSSCTAELDALGEIASLVRVHGVPIAPRPRTAPWPAPVPSAPPPRAWHLRLSSAGALAAALAVIALFGFFRLETAHLPISRGASPSAPSDATTTPAAPGADGAGEAHGTTPTIVARLDLGAGPRRGEGTLPALRLPAGAREVEVTFIVPGGGEAASVRIEDEQGRAISGPAPAPPHDAMGRTRLVVPAQAFDRSGAWALVLSQREDDAGAPVEYRYPFYLQSPAATNPAQ
jgi:hypothetical protein